MNTKKPKILAAGLPEFLPNIHYFVRMAIAEEFIIADNVQYAARSRCQRTHILENEKASWLTLPILQNHKRKMIRDTQIDQLHFSLKKYRRRIQASYMHFAWYDYFEAELFEVLNSGKVNLFEYNMNIIHTIRELLQITTPLKFASEISIDKSKNSTQQIVNLLNYSEANIYLASPSDRQFLKVDLFGKNNIKLYFIEFQNGFFSKTDHNFFAFHSLFSSGSELISNFKKIYFKDLNQ